ncbi:hypothetical protein [Alkalimarinus alittae]|uniref:Uncharacterized protein n=1 Tax=Alkalimarinus alittae TaxID=2961619 RepID=A0ABY6N2J0_9ALTE|nr:hypothetical protein [Alkalimarinus alittae]UZE96313.1 hypothetical protein NKI27_00795 [Alkalimarinus alittae]
MRILFLIFLGATLFCSIFSVQAAKVFIDNVAGDASQEHRVPASISADGQYIVYASNSANSIDAGTQKVSDVFLKNIRSGNVTLLSSGLAGAKSNGASVNPAISADGHYVAFASVAGNLVLGDQNNAVDIFLYQRASGELERLVEFADFAKANFDHKLQWPGNIDLSGDGRIVVFDTAQGQSADLGLGSNSDMRSQIFIIDRDRQHIEVLHIEGHSQSDFRHPAISEDGRYVAFELTAFNSGIGESSTLTRVLLFDRELNKAIPVSLNTKGIEGNGSSFRPKISKAGRYVSFYSDSSNLAASDMLNPSNPDVVKGIYIRDLTSATTQLLTSANRDWPNAEVSPVFDMSPDGRFIAFSSKASNLTDDGQLMCEKRGLSSGCFWQGTSQIFRYDRLLDHMQLISTDEAGFPLDKSSIAPSISADGRRLTFTSVFEPNSISRRLYLAEPTYLSALTLLSPSYNVFEPYPTYSWDASSSAVAYRVLSDDGAITRWLSAEDLGCATSSRCAVTPLTELDYGLTPLYVQAVTARGELSPLAAPLYVYRRPETPVAQALSIPEGSLATLKWNKVADAVSYRILVLDKMTREVIVNEVVGDVAAHTLPFKLASSTEYSYAVRVQSPTGVYSDWASISYRPEVGIPMPSLPLGSTDKLTPTFTWSQVDTAAQYRIIIQDIDTGEMTNNVLGGESRYRHNALFELGHRYRWKVRAQMPEGGYSQWQYFEVGDNTIFRGEHNVTLRWAAPDKRLDGSALNDFEISHYVIEYQRGQTGEGHRIEVGPQRRALALNSLTEGYYQFVIKAVDQQGLASDSSNRVSVNVPLSAGQ